uniref:Uncharacterized protein n=1 Tax=viral metagenome TaxID=1070528 RepID=A0A6C0AVU5_9ZZZZ|tara:strand:+ start:12916 stop:13203 length:288 start_codon:yes stop_codon:yes gene_type:complete
MRLVLFINLLNAIFVAIILYNLLYPNLVREGLTSNQEKIQNKIKELEKDIKSVKSLNPLAPCASIYPIVEDNTDKINSMKSTINDLKANCQRQNS